MEPLCFRCVYCCIRFLRHGLFLIAVTWIHSVQSQDTIRALPRWMFNLQTTFLIPQDPMDRYLDHLQWGYQMEGMYRIQYNKPFLAGLYFQEEGLSKYVIKYTQVNSDGNIDIREKANTRRLEWGLTAGFYPEVNWLIQPFLQGRFGMVVYQSSSILVDRDEWETIDRISEHTEYVPSYGLDLGIHIVPNIWFLRGDLRFGMVANPSATYLTLNEELKEGVEYPIQAFEPHTSSGLWLKITAGISYLF